MVRIGQRQDETGLITCSHSDFNYARNEADKCVLVPGTTALPDDDSCKYRQQYWYERTAYRKIPYSTCEGGDVRDLGTKHVCPGFGAHGAVFWMFIIMIPFAFTALVGYYYYRRRALSQGYVYCTSARNEENLNPLCQQDHPLAV